VAMRRHVDKKGQEMGFFTVEDFTGSVECTSFGSVWPAVVPHMKPDAKLMVTGRVQRRGDRVGMIVSKVETLTRACQAAGEVVAKEREGERARERVAERAAQAPRPGWTHRLSITFRVGLTTQEQVDQVLHALRGRPGTDRVIHSFVADDGWREGPHELRALDGGPFGVQADKATVDLVLAAGGPGTQAVLETVVATP